MRSWKIILQDSLDGKWCSWYFHKSQFHSGSVYAMWLHGFCPFNIQLFTSSTHRFAFTDNKFKWDEFYIYEFVSFRIKMLWYCVVGLVFYDSSVFSKSVSQCVFRLSYILLVCWGCFPIGDTVSCKWDFWIRMWSSIFYVL